MATEYREHAYKGGRLRPENGVNRRGLCVLCQRPKAVHQRF